METNFCFSYTWMNSKKTNEHANKNNNKTKYKIQASMHQTRKTKSTRMGYHNYPS